MDFKIDLCARVEHEQSAIVDHAEEVGISEGSSGSFTHVFYYFSGSMDSMVNFTWCWI